MDLFHQRLLLYRSLPSALVLVLTLCSIPILASTQPASDSDSNLSLRLLPQATVDSSGISLHQLVASDATNAIPDVRLATAPPPGRFIVLSRFQITELIRRSAPILVATNWTGANQIQISRRSRILDETELKALLTQAIAESKLQDQGELELRFPRPWTPIPVPDEPLTIRILDLPTTGVSPFFIVRFELIAANERVGHWQLPLQAQLWQEVLIARSPLRRGQLLANADLIAERRDILSVHETLSLDARSDTSLELMVNVNADQPILNRYVRQRSIVLRGHQVPAIIRNGPLTISLKVEALEDGHVGQMVRVRNPRTRRELTGIVQNEHSILICL